MDDNVLLAIAKLFRAQQDEIRELWKEVRKPDDLETIMADAELEHRLEQIDAQIELLEHGKDWSVEDA
jgi:hypothetical protein